MALFALVQPAVGFDGCVLTSLFPSNPAAKTIAVRPIGELWRWNAVPAAAGSARAAARVELIPPPRSPDARPTPERLARVVGPPLLLGDFLGRGGACLGQLGLQGVQAIARRIGTAPRRGRRVTPRRSAEQLTRSYPLQ